jgi:WD40 repeat protein
VRAGTTQEKYKNCWVPRVARVGEAVAAKSRADLRSAALSRDPSTAFSSSSLTTAASTAAATAASASSSSPSSSVVDRRQQRLQKIHGVKSPMRLGKNLVHAPSDWHPPATKEDMDALIAPPNAHLKINRTRNGVGPAAIGELSTGELVFGSGCIVVIQNNSDGGSQRFFQEHDATVSCIAVSPCGRMVASGQSKSGPILVWDALVIGDNSDEAVANSNKWRPNIYHARYRPVSPRINDMHRAKTLSRINAHGSSGVRCLDFSPDKVLLVSVGGDHTIYISKWRSCEILAAARCSTEILSLRFNPFSCWPLPNEYAEEDEHGMPISTFHIPVAGQAFRQKDAFYNLVSVGKKHLKFWTLEVDGSDAAEGHPNATAKNIGPVASLAWKLASGTPSRSRLCDVDQDFTSVAFIDDGESLRHFNADLGVFVYFPSGEICSGQGEIQGDNRQNGAAITATAATVATAASPTTATTAGHRHSRPRPWGGKESRVLVGSAKGDLYVFYQPRRPRIGTLHLPSQSRPRPWWEQEMDGSLSADDAAYSLKWNTTARVVFVLPRSVEQGNKILLRHEQQQELERTRLEIKRRRLRRGSPMTSSTAQSIDELLQREDALQYAGPLGHNGTITAMASQRDEEENRVVTCGADMELRMWRVTMHARPQIKGIDGALYSSPGSHEFVLVKKKKLTCTSVSTLSWKGDRIILKTREGILHVSSDTLATCTLVESPHNGAIRTVRAHPSLPFITLTDRLSVTLWSTKHAHVNRAKNTSAKTLSQCLAKYVFPSPSDDGGGCCLDFYPSTKECVLAVGTHSGTLLTLMYRASGGIEPGNLEQLVQMQRIEHAGHANAMQPFHPSQRSNAARKLAAAAAAAANVQTNEWLCLRFSPDGKLLAGACRRETRIYLYSVSPQSSNASVIHLSRVVHLNGHSSAVRSLDWSVDGQIIQSNDYAREICYWDAHMHTLIRTPIELRDVEWASWSCHLGWPVSGLHRDGGRESDVLALSRSHSKRFGVMSGTGSAHPAVQLFAWPLLSQKAGFRHFWGHDRKILALEWDRNDSKVYSCAGGTVFEWSIEETRAEIEMGTEAETEIKMVAKDNATAVVMSKQEHFLIAKPYESVTRPNIVSEVGLNQNHHNHQKQEQQSAFTPPPKPPPKPLHKNVVKESVDKKRTAPDDPNIWNADTVAEIVEDVVDSLILIIEVEQKSVQQHNMSPISPPVSLLPDLQTTSPEEQQPLVNGASERQTEEVQSSNAQQGDKREQREQAAADAHIQATPQGASTKAKLTQSSNAPPGDDGQNEDDEKKSKAEEESSDSIQRKPKMSAEEPLIELAQGQIEVEEQNAPSAQQAHATANAGGANIALPLDGRKNEDDEKKSKAEEESFDSIQRKPKKMSAEEPLMQQAQEQEEAEGQNGTFLEEQAHTTANTGGANIASVDVGKNEDAEYAAAVKLQSTQRGLAARAAIVKGEVEAHVEKKKKDYGEHEMATRIQAAARGWIQRMNIDAKSHAKEELRKNDGGHYNAVDAAGNTGSENAQQAAVNKHIKEHDPMLGHEKRELRV